MSRRRRREVVVVVVVEVEIEVEFEFEKKWLGKAGLEPARLFSQISLNYLSLPIPHFPLRKFFYVKKVK